MGACVEVQNLTFSYSGGAPLLRGVSFEVSQGEFLVVAGRSGCGKTTLCHILCGIIPNAIKGELRGKVSVMGAAPAEAGLSQTSLKAGMVFQDPDDQLISTTVEDELAFALENHCRPPEEIRRCVDELLAEFGLTALRLTNPAHLSGGQKKLVTIAAVLAPDPPVLILDEPLSGLDHDGRCMVAGAIERQRRKGRAVIIVEHDLEMFKNADSWLLLGGGEVAAYGAPRDIMWDEDLLISLGVWA